MSMRRFGKIEYTEITIPDYVEGAPMKWCYSAKELQEELSQKFIGHKLIAVYVGLDGYLNSFHLETNYIDMSYLFGGCIVLFDNAVLDLGLHVAGEFNYRIIPPYLVKRRTRKDYAPDDYNALLDCYVNIENHDITVEIANQAVTDITVPGMDMWAFSIDGFDEEKADAAAQANDLPAEIDIHTEKYTIRIIGDDIEYYVLKIDKKSNLMYKK